MLNTQIVVPCYNEADRLAAWEFRAFASRNPPVEFLFVNDGSTDQTAAVLERLSEQLAGQAALLHLETNCGKAEAVRRGMLAALERSPDLVGYWDADLATPLGAIPEFEQTLRQRPACQLVLGSRVSLLGRSIERTRRRKILGRLFAAAASTVLGLPVYDTQCGAKMFRAGRWVAETFARPFHSRWIFDVEILARMIRQGIIQQSAAADVVYELPLASWRDVAGSKLKGGDFVKAANELLGIHRKYAPRRTRARSHNTGCNAQPTTTFIADGNESPQPPTRGRKAA